MYWLKTDKKVDKFLIKHPGIKKRFFLKVSELTENPFKNNLDITELSWEKSHFRLRIWKYRFLYEIKNQEILIYFYDADSRWSIYKN